MTNFGMVRNGNLIHAPASGLVNGSWIVNMTAAHHAARGELPIDYSAEPPAAENGYHCEQDGWRVNDAGDGICRSWRLVQDAPKETISVGTIGDIKAAVRKLAGLAGVAVSAFALCIRAASVQIAGLNEIDLDGAATVVTGVDFAGLATQADVDSIAGNVANLWTYVYGENAWIAISNYLSSSSAAATMRMYEVREGVTNEVYSTRREIASAISPAIAAATNALAGRAWSRYQSMTGEANPAPEYATVISTPSTLFAGGLEWQKFADARGSAFLLTGRGAFTAAAGAFKITDETGKTFWQISTTADVVTNAPAAFVGWTNGIFSATFISPVQPTLYVSASLADAFLAAADEPNVSAAWTADGAGKWRCEVAFVDRPPAFFAVAKSEVVGVEAITHEVPTNLAGGLLIDGVRYNLVPKIVDGGLVLGLEAADD